LKLITFLIFQGYGLFKGKRKLNARENFWANLFRKDIYALDYDSYFFVVCSADGNQNWEAKCGSEKRNLRFGLLDWWKLAKFEENGQELDVKQHLDMYHIFTGYDQKGLCLWDVECMTWIVGLKFIQQQEKPNSNLTEDGRKKLMETFEWGKEKNHLLITHAMNKTELKHWLDRKTIH
jgi:hypothetical protein